MQTLVVADFKTGLDTGQQPYLVNNDAFPVLSNAYVWRGSVYKKRGNSFLGRPYLTLTAQPASQSDGAGVYDKNILTLLSANILTPDAGIVAGSVSIDCGSIFTDPDKDGTLSPNGFIDYATGHVRFTTTMNTPATVTLQHYANLPIMGVEDFFRTSSGTFAVKGIPETIVFDTVYSYSTNNALPPVFANVNRFKASGAGFVWRGQNYQQFYTTNYQSAMWATNGNPGFQFVDISAISAAAQATITSNAHGLSDGDYVFIYEVLGNDAMMAINGFSGAIFNTTPNTFDVDFSTALGAYTSGGIAQSLTRVVSNTDGIRWFDGNPTSTSTGWVNFMPPLDNRGLIGLKSDYLIGAKLIVAFKNRLLFFGPTIATSTTPGGQFYPNRVVYSQIGIPYYASPLPVAFPSNTLPSPGAFWTNIAGKGGFIDAPIPDAIVSVEPNLDVLICAFESRPLRMVFTGDDSLPFVYQTINSEYGAQSTFAAIPLDTGVINFGEYGVALSTQVSAQRIDLQIPDQIFDIGTLNNGLERVTAVRDYRNEFIYFSYPPKEFEYVAGEGNLFNSRTLVYNYRNNTWALFTENFTHYGTYRISTGLTWASLDYRTWSKWDKQWNFGGYSQAFPNIVGGNQQGFLMIKGQTVNEDVSQFIKAIVITPPLDPLFEDPTVTITSPNHCLQDGDFIQISGVIGVINVNNQIFKIVLVDSDKFNLLLDENQSELPPAEVSFAPGFIGYLGLGVYSRLSNLNIITKQFPMHWGSRRKTRVGTQRFLMDETENGEVTINVYVNQSDIASSSPAVSSYPAFTNVMLTRPEPNMPSQATQDEIWHRVSNSFNGDTVQFEITLSEDQMRDELIVNSDVVLNAICLEMYPGPFLS